DRPDRVDELILVAPADAAAFDCAGPRARRSRHEERFRLDHVLPREGLLKQLQTHRPAQGSVARTMLRRGRGSHLAALRQLTRKQWETLPASLPPMQDSE